MKLHKLFEVDKPAKTKTASKIDLDSMFQAKPDQPLVPQKPDTKQKSAPQNMRDVPAGVSKQKTAQATAEINLDNKAMGHIANLHANAPADSDVDEPEIPNTEVVVHTAADVPTVVSKSMVAAGFVDPDFHLVANLPGNISSAIRQLGKQLFSSLTTTPTDKISMVGNLGGQGPNSMKEVHAVANYVKEHGEDLGPGEIDFDKIMPGYKAKIHNFKAEGVHFMLVKDDFGNYIYAWPANTSVIGHSGAKQIKESVIAKLHKTMVK